MNIDDITLIEHIATKSPLSLMPFCDIVQVVLSLPEFEYDSENETEWGISFNDGVQYEVSRPYKAETLRKWDATVPEGFNFGLKLIFRKGATVSPTSASKLVREVGQALAVALGAPVAHHRTWLGVGNNVARNALFLSKPSDA